MIFESFPWKQDLRRRKNLIIKYNTAEHFEKNDDTTYTVIEKAIFYSAFIIRKLIDCGGKLSDESENYSLKVCSVQPLKPVDRLHRWPEEDSHDWENEKEVVVTGKNVCNWLIHSYMFFVVFNEDGIIDSFSVTSDFDRNKVLYRIPLDAWMEYMDYIASDDIVGMSSHYDPKAETLKSKFSVMNPVPASGIQFERCCSDVGKCIQCRQSDLAALRVPVQRWRQYGRLCVADEVYAYHTVLFLWTYRY